MAKQIELTLSKPYSLTFVEMVDRVILPAVKGDITILPDRAPIQLMLRDGLMQILDAQGKSLRKYFIKGGVVDINANKCLVAAEDSFEFESISLHQAEVLLEREELHEGDKDFYQMIVRKHQIYD